MKRDAHGKIISLSELSDADYSECLEAGHPDILAFLDSARQALHSSDSDTIRVIEDLIELLVRKNIIMLTDLPDAAQQKLSLRQRMRSELNVLDNLMVREEDIL